MGRVRMAGWGALLTFLWACPETGPSRVAAPPDSAAGEVAFRLAGPNQAAILIPVELNGQGPFDFVLDTGATLTCVDSAVAARLALPERRGLRGVGAGVGGSGRIRLVEIDSVQVGETRAYDLTGCVLDLEGARSIGVEAHGLLGLDFLKPFRVVLDFERGVMGLSDPATDGAAQTTSMASP